MNVSKKTKTVRSEVVRFRATPALRERLEAAAENDCRSLSSFLEHLCTIATDAENGKFNNRRQA
jgi:hypothetical protein